jgi:hypothetical protein
MTVFTAVTLMGCTKSEFRPVVTPLPERRAIISPRPNHAAVTSSLHYEGGVLRGALEYTKACRYAIARQTHTDTIETITPNRRAGFSAMVPGLIISAISLGILTSLDTFSDDDSCSAGETPPCASTRDAVTGWSVVGLGTGASLVTTGLVTQFLPTRTKTVSSADSAPEVVRVIGESAPCGEGPAKGFDLSLKLNGELELGKTITDQVGQFAFLVPANVAGRLIVSVEGVPELSSLVTTGTIVSSFDYPPTDATTTTPTTTAPLSSPMSFTAPPKTNP